MDFYVSILWIWSLACELVNQWPQMFPYFSFLLVYEESHIEEKSREIKEKDQAIASKEHIIKEKSGNIVSLETEIASLQVSGWIL